jgi:hypothetical protein
MGDGTYAAAAPKVIYAENNLPHAGLNSVKSLFLLSPPDWKHTIKNCFYNSMVRTKHNVMLIYHAPEL